MNTRVERFLDYVETRERILKEKELEKNKISNLENQIEELKQMILKMGANNE